MDYTSFFGVKKGLAVCYSGYRNGQRPGHIYPSYDEVTEDLTITTEGSFTCTKLGNCIHFGASGLTIDNKGTIKINGGLDRDNVIRAANSADDNSTINNSGTIVNETGNNAIYYSITDSGYIYNTGTISATTKSYTIRSQDNTNFKIDNSDLFEKLMISYKSNEIYINDYGYKRQL